MSFSANAEEFCEVITFNDSERAESEHFVLTAQAPRIDGWNVTLSGNKITLDAKSDEVLITAIVATVGKYGDYYSEVQYSVGKKAENTHVPDGSRVHVIDINRSHLEISTVGPDVRFDDFRIFYTTREPGEPIVFNGQKTASSAKGHFRVTAESVDNNGWNTGKFMAPIVVESKSDVVVITSVEAVVGFGGEDVADVTVNSGTKEETGAVEDGSVIHISNIYSSRLEIKAENLFKLKDMTVHYTVIAHEHVLYSDIYHNNEDGTHSQLCALCFDNCNPTAHTFTEWTVAKEATLSETGTEERSCTLCHAKETREIPVLAGLMGDVNKDGKVNAADALLTLKAAVGKVELSEVQNFVGDVNKDGKINAADALMILKKSVGKPAGF